MLRDNNPLNIRFRSEGYWQGQAPSRGAFCKFYDLKWGFRAAFRLMLTYYEKYHRDTVDAIINSWAPPTENDTEAYIKFVVSDLRKQWRNLREDTSLPHPREHPRLWIALALAMTRMECGSRSITLAVEESAAEGYRLLFESLPESQE